MLDKNPDYAKVKISRIDKEAFVELFLLEDIVRLYERLLENEESYVSTSRAVEAGKQFNIKRFSAIIELFKAAIGVARVAILGGDYKAVWKAIPEMQLTMAANGGIKALPKLREIGGEILLQLIGEIDYDVAKQNVAIQLILEAKKAIPD